jgi:hypothetical protein
MLAAETAMCVGENALTYVDVVSYLIAKPLVRKLRNWAFSV